MVLGVKGQPRTLFFSFLLESLRATKLELALRCCMHSRRVKFYHNYVTTPTPVSSSSSRARSLLA